MLQIKDRRQRFIKMPQMEGAIARWYAGLRGSATQMQDYRAQAAKLTDGLPDGAAVLEIAPGPGYLAVEIARLGRFGVTGLDISRSFAAIADQYAQRERVTVEFRQGDAAAMPFAGESFDLLICQAAFKNFAQPARAIAEMYRVLRPGGSSIIQDMRRDTSAAEIRQGVREMRLAPINAFMTRLTLGMLRHRAYSPAQFERLAQESPFRGCEILTQGIGMEVRLTKSG